MKLIVAETGEVDEETVNSPTNVEILESGDDSDAFEPDKHSESDKSGGDRDEDIEDLSSNDLSDGGNSKQKCKKVTVLLPNERLMTIILEKWQTMYLT